MSPAHPENWPVHTEKGTVDAALLRDVAALVAAAEESDGNPPLSEQTLVTLRAGDTGEHSVLALALYAPDDKLDPATAQDLAVSPSSSRNPTAPASSRSPSIPATATRAWATACWAN